MGKSIMEQQPLVIKRPSCSPFFNIWVFSKEFVIERVTVATTSVLTA